MTATAIVLHAQPAPAPLRNREHGGATGQQYAGQACGHRNARSPRAPGIMRPRNTHHTSGGEPDRHLRAGRPRHGMRRNAAQHGDRRHGRRRQVAPRPEFDPAGDGGPPVAPSPAARPPRPRPAPSGHPRSTRRRDQTGAMTTSAPVAAAVGLCEAVSTTEKWSGSQQNQHATRQAGIATPARRQHPHEEHGAHHSCPQHAGRRLHRDDECHQRDDSRAPATAVRSAMRKRQRRRTIVTLAPDAPVRQAAARTFAAGSGR